MLSLGRKRGEVVVIGDDIRVTVIRVGRGRVRLGIEAPRDVRVDREEVRRAKDRGRGRAGEG